MGKAELFNNNLEESVSYLEQALRMKPLEGASEKALEELKELHSKATKKLAEQNKKEKEKWSKAFKKNAEVESDPPAQVEDPLSPPSTTTGSFFYCSLSNLTQIAH